MFNLACILRESAAAYPAKPVALWDGGQLTYAELDIASDRVALALQELGVLPGERIGLQLPNIAPFLISYFGILKAGAAVVPLNVLLRAREVAFHLGDCRARALITWAGVAPEAVKGATEVGVPDVFVVGDLPEGLPANVQPFGRLMAPRPSAHRPLAVTRPEDTAVIVYTSGTTGRPKGAELTHFQLYMNADIPGRLFDLQPDDVVLTVLPLFHVFGLSSVLNCAVRFGATMSLVPRFTAEAALTAIQAHGVTIFEGVPTMFVALLTCPTVDDYDVATLRIGISGGAAIPAEVLDRFEKRFGMIILEGYGLSETASTTTFNCSATDRRVYSVGRPIWGTQVQIWDTQNQPLSAGKDNIGEIVTRGYHTMKGYLGDPEATAEAFTDGWLHTGDLGYIDQDGYVFVVDRKKELIIRGGYNVYPREVEEVLYSHPAVNEAAVLGIPDERLGEEVLAVVSLKPGASARPEELIEFCKQHLAAYKYPRVIDLREQLPKSGTGKILKLELRSTLHLDGPHLDGTAG
jgi:long-chain acyl-CoA synthetase